MLEIMGRTDTQSLKNEFHGYVGEAVLLKSGRVARILAGHGQKLYVKTLDGTIQECYHNDLEYVFMEENGKSV